MLESTRRIVSLIKAVPRGRVACYRGIALAAGMPHGARQVARVLHSLSGKESLPWHRVVRADGSIALPAGGGREEQAALLRSEGVAVSEAGKVDMRRFGAAAAPPS
ncbi:MAG: methylated-DNA-protein-cysteine methyltransferase related protein [Treponematales bacterium]